MFLEEYFMKFSYFIKLVIFASCALFYTASSLCFPLPWDQTPKTEEEQSKKQQRNQDLQLSKLTDKLNEATFFALITSMQTIETNLEYWRKAQTSPRYQTLLRGPHGWFDSQETSTVIQNYVAKLELLEQ